MWSVEKTVAIVALVLISTVAAAQSWPTKPLKIIVAFPPGGSNDLSARILAKELAPRLGQSVIVENRPGAGSLIGTEYAAKSAPDGYTFLLGGTPSLAINHHVYKVNYNPLRDFAPITGLGSSVVMLAAHPSLQVKTARELVSLAAKRPNEINYGSAGIGSTFHISAALFCAVTGAKLTHIPNKGSVEALADLIAGRTQVQADALHILRPHVLQDKIRAIGVMNKTRTPLLPDVPTMTEQGFEGLEVGTGTGFVAPAGTPDAILDRMHAELVKVLNIPDVRERFAKMGIDLGERVLSRKEHGAQMVAQDAFWGNAVKSAGVKVE